jgi:hypothetical protein
LGRRAWLAIIGLAVVAALAVGSYQMWWHANFYVVEWNNYEKPLLKDELGLFDDRLEYKKPKFDPELVDSRPIGDWQVNASAAVIKLDCPLLKPDDDAELLVLRPSYAAAIKAAGSQLLPSANLLDGAAKQFDDGLYAALDLAVFRGELGTAPAAPDVIATIFDKLPADSPARPFLGVALKLAGREVELPADQRAAADRLLAEFDADQARSKPISFYTWSDELKQVFRFYRFLQREFDERDAVVPRAIAAVLASDAKLREHYAAVNGLYSRLTNLLACLGVDALAGSNEELAALAKRRGLRRATVAVFPPSTSRETELFNAVFPRGVPEDANLMARLIHAIRSGEVDLKPGEKDGWYQYQVYALETMLLPSRGQEEQKLLLTASYKKRLIEAFKALITKRRETHARQLRPADSAKMPLGRSEVRPRLRVEPCATFYLRTARAYAFLQNFLLTTVGNERLAKLHGRRQKGERESNLADELEAIRLRSYGFYLLACEDIGMKPELLKDEPVDQAAAGRAASEWLAKMEANPDLACDTRVSVPIYLDPINNKTRLWATLGVRLARLEASYARSPQVRPKDGGGQWREVEFYQLGKSHYLIPVDEFAEITLSGSASLTRDELRAACDRHKIKEAIAEALSK